MNLKPGCESFAKKVIPVLRARIALSLADDHHMQQYEISKKIGVTQAAVSFYLGKERGASQSIVKKFPEIDETAKKMAKALKDGKSDEALKKLMCDLCHKVAKKKSFKAMLKGNGN